MNEITNNEVNELSVSNLIEKIRPESDMSFSEAKSFWDDIFSKELQYDDSESVKEEKIENNLDKDLQDYFKDIKEKSDCPETIKDIPIDKLQIEKISREENAEMRDQFDKMKGDLKKEWEEINGRPWPKYEEDVISDNGVLIRKAGDDYDAHHIIPLGWGGKNEAGNITPLRAEVHYDRQGVHSPDSPYSRVDNALGGVR